MDQPADSSHSATAPVLMAIDAGGSTLRLSAQTANGQLVDHQTHPSGRQQLGYPFVEKSAPLLAAFAKERNVTLAVGTDAHGLHYAWDAAGLGDIPLVTLSEVILATSPISASDVVLIAGTGSTCATVVYGHRSQVTGALGCDKDPGCGVSIGRATRAAITAARSKQGPQTALVDAISLTESQLAALDLPALASLATTTSQVGYAGDPVAASICTRAASELMKLLGPHDVVYYARSGIITQGSVIGPGSLVGDLVRQSLASSDIPIKAHLTDLCQPAMAWAQAIHASQGRHVLLRTAAQMREIVVSGMPHAR